MHADRPCEAINQLALSTKWPSCRIGVKLLSISLGRTNARDTSTLRGAYHFKSRPGRSSNIHHSATQALAAFSTLLFYAAVELADTVASTHAHQLHLRRVCSLRVHLGMTHLRSQCGPRSSDFGNNNDVHRYTCDGAISGCTKPVMNALCLFQMSLSVYALPKHLDGGYCIALHGHQAQHQ